MPIKVRLNRLLCGVYYSGGKKGDWMFKLAKLLNLEVRLICANQKPSLTGYSMVNLIREGKEEKKLEI